MGAVSRRIFILVCRMFSVQVDNKKPQVLDPIIVFLTRVWCNTCAEIYKGVK